MPLGASQCQNNLEKRTKLKHHTPWFKAVLQICSNKNTIKQNRESRNKPMHIWSINWQWRSQENTMGKGQFLQEMVLGKLNSHMQKNDIGLPYYTTYKINSKLIKKLNEKHETIKFLE